MKVRVLSILAAGAMVISVAGPIAQSASASRVPSFSYHGKAIAPHAVAGKRCNTTRFTVNQRISSQNFEASLDVFDSQGAADCRFKRKKTVHQIVVPGLYFNGPGPAVSENVFAYKDAAGIPGALINSQTVIGSDSDGTFTIPLTPYKVKGKVWFSVQANEDFGTGGEWAWDASATPYKQPDQWINPGGGDGFGTGWQPISNLNGTTVSFLLAVS